MLRPLLLFASLALTTHGAALRRSLGGPTCGADKTLVIEQFRIRLLKMLTTPPRGEARESDRSAATLSQHTGYVLAGGHGNARQL